MCALPFHSRLFGRFRKSRESCPNNNISPGALTGEHCSLSVKWYTGHARPQLKPGTAGPMWAEGLAWQRHNVGLTGPTCQHSRGLVDISIRGCTDPLTCFVDLSFSCLYRPTVCSLLCHHFLCACQLSRSLISPALLDHRFPRVGYA